MTGVPRFSGNPGANALATIVVANRVGHHVCISNVMWSYNAAPTAGSLNIVDAQGERQVQVDITAAGPGFILGGDGWAEFEAGSGVTLTLAAGGAAVTGKLSCLVWYKPIAS